LEIECSQCKEKFKVDWPENKKGKPYREVAWLNSRHPENESVESASCPDKLIMDYSKEEFPLRLLLVHHVLTRANVKEFSGFVYGHADYKTKDGKSVDVSGRVCIIRG
jgi:hypothetical protein